ncbi:ADP-ribosyl-[dinitrogen reductase] hydrolase [Anaerohalosphaera lusitana]|uniref:ADP-ribosyl-[dinitrogen reductase] hydrolase n=1 Tax=Anaerohalosphaera lusitana TaxID=1936003 RepID=A0A1U9NQW9_9BACT|nr:ADP-ribosylglycohydrolase family protein [Anaerohalosphaera lusitana]AQT70309.1 ADP-ribosyl-[dinitrogen reductase] hydrolase [Anaerohalosphaera lusitana]
MIGAIVGDIVGSVFEWRGTKREDFELFGAGCRFTDDTVLTVATAWAILRGEDYGVAYKRFGRKWPGAGYGGNFAKWLRSDSMGAYGSWGNGSAMRVSPVAWAFESVEEVLKEAERSAAVTHDHPEGIKGAQAVAMAVYLARRGFSKAEIVAEVGARFEYDLDRRLDEIRPGYGFDSSCAGSVPEAMIAFGESEGFEDAVRKAVSLGGDSDTQACMAGAVAEAFYGGVPGEIRAEAERRLDVELGEVVREFEGRFGG